MNLCVPGERPETVRDLGPGEAELRGKTLVASNWAQISGGAGGNWRASLIGWKQPPPLKLGTSVNVWRLTAADHDLERIFLLDLDPARTVPPCRMTADCRCQLGEESRDVDERSVAVGHADAVPKRGVEGHRIAPVLQPYPLDVPVVLISVVAVMC